MILASKYNNKVDKKHVTFSVTTLTAVGIVVITASLKFNTSFESLKLELSFMQW